MIDLSKNTNCYYPSERILKKMKKSIDTINNYSDAYVKIEDEDFLKTYNIKPENLILTNGAMEGMDLILRSLKLKKIGLFYPTFWGIKEISKNNNYNILDKKLKMEPEYNVEDIIDLVKKTNIIYLCNDNNPTLHSINRKTLLNVIKENKDKYFLIDETTLPFNGKYNQRSLIRYVNKYPNLIVVLSLSKIFGICGLRCGLVFANKKTIKEIQSIQLPYSNNTIATAFVNNFLSEFKKLNNCRAKINKNFKFLINNLDKDIAKKTYYKESSFVLVELNLTVNYNNFVEYIKDNGIVVSKINQTYPNLEENYIRISSGKKGDFKKLIKLFKDYKEKYYEKSIH